VRNDLVSGEADPVAFDDLASAGGIEAVDLVAAVTGEEENTLVPRLRRLSRLLDLINGPESSSHVEPTSPCPPSDSAMNST